MTHSRPWGSDVPPAVVGPWSQHVSQTSRFHCVSLVVDEDASARKQVVARVSGTIPAGPPAGPPAPEAFVDVHGDSLM